MDIEPTASPERPRPPRVALTRDRILDAAMQLADRNGVMSLSMRKLGEAVGVEAMSLYNHVAGKDALLDGMIDLVFAEIDLPAEGGDWKTALRNRYLSARDVLARHRWAIPLMESRATPGPANLRQHDAVLRCLRSNGFPLALAAHAFSLLDAYLYGFALTERSLPFEGPEETAQVAKAIFSEFAANQYPHLTEIATQHVMQPGYDYGEEFHYGLDLILDGLEQARQRASSRNPGP